MKQKNILGIVILTLIVLSTSLVMSESFIDQETLIEKIYLPSPEQTIKTNTLLFIIQTSEDIKRFNKIAKDLEAEEIILFLKKGLNFNILDEEVKKKIKTVFFKQNPFIEKDPLISVYSEDDEKLLVYENLGPEYLEELSLISEKTNLLLDILPFEFDKENVIITERHVLLGSDNQKLKNLLEKEFGIIVILIDQAVPKIKDLITPISSNTLVIGDPVQAQLEREVLASDDLKEIEQAFVDEYLEKAKRTEDGRIKLGENAVTEEEYKKLTKEKLGEYIKSSFEEGLKLKEKIEKIVQELKQKGYRIKRVPFLPTNKIYPGITPTLTYNPLKFGKTLLIPQYGLANLDNRALKLFEEEKPKKIDCGITNLNCNTKVLKQNYVPTKEELTIAKANKLIRKITPKQPLLEKHSPSQQPELDLPTTISVPAPKKEETHPLEEAPYTPGPRTPQHPEVPQPTTPSPEQLQTTINVPNEVIIGGELEIIVVDANKNQIAGTSDEVEIELETQENNNQVTGSFWTPITGFFSYITGTQFYQERQKKKIHVKEIGNNKGIFETKVKILDECNINFDEIPCFSVEYKDKIIVNYIDSYNQEKRKIVNVKRDVEAEQNSDVELVNYELFVDNNNCEKFNCEINENSQQLRLRLTLKNKGESQTSGVFQIKAFTEYKKSYEETVLENLERVDEIDITELLSHDQEVAYTLNINQNLKNYLQAYKKNNKINFEWKLKIIAGKNIEITEEEISYDPISNEQNKENNKGEVLIKLKGEFEEVDKLNNPPKITSTPSQTATINQQYIYEITAEDKDEDEISLLLIEGPEGMILSDKKILWTPSQDQEGIHEITIKVTDIQGMFEEQKFTISVNVKNNPPRIVNTPITSVNYYDTYLDKIIAVDDEGDEIIYSLLDAPRDMRINANTGDLHWTPPDGSFLDTINKVQILISDDKENTLVYEFFITVGNANHQPRFISEPVTTAVQGQKYIYNIKTEDGNEEDDLFVGLHPFFTPEGMKLTQTSKYDHIITWTPTNEQALLGKNFHEIRMLVDDGTGTENGQDMQTFFVTVQNVNDPPIITSEQPISNVIIGEPFIYHVTAQDPDNDSLKLGISSGDWPQNMLLNPVEMTLTWTPTEIEYRRRSLYNFTISVTDNEETALQKIVLYLIKPIEEPQFISNPKRVGRVGRAYNYVVKARTEDASNLEFALKKAPEGMSITQQPIREPGNPKIWQTIIHWQPENSDIGTYEVIISTKKTDYENSEPVEQKFELSIDNSPKITSIPELNALIGKEYYYQVTAEDENKDPLTYSLSLAPEGMSIDNNGKITWNPSEEQKGVQTIVVRVEDDKETIYQANQRFYITVEDFFCGNNFCDSEENSLTCPQDCPESPAELNPDMGVLDYYLTINDELCVNNKCIASNKNDQIKLKINIKNFGSGKTIYPFFASAFHQFEELKKSTITQMIEPRETKLIELKLPNSLIIENSEKQYSTQFFVHEGIEVLNDQIIYTLLTDELDDQTAMQNTKPVSFIIQHLGKDLQIEELKTKQTELYESQPLDIKVLIEDVNNNIDEDFKIKLSYDNLIFEIGKSELSKNGKIYFYTKNINNEELLKTGPHTISLSLDPSQSITGEKKDNNYQEIQVQIKQSQPPDYCPSCPAQVNCQPCPSNQVRLGFPVILNFNNPRIIQSIYNNAEEITVRINWKIFDKNNNLLDEFESINSEILKNANGRFLIKQLNNEIVNNLEKINTIKTTVYSVEGQELANRTDDVGVK